MTTIYTIGHSNHRWETFLALLLKHDIRLLVDVRTRPVSRFAPFANRGRFPGLLSAEGVEYRFMGDNLGGRPDDPSLYDENGRPDYGKMAGNDDFNTSIVELAPLAEDLRTVIMCSEEDPTRCHRLLLIAPALEAHGVQTLHIRKTGVAISQLPIDA